MNNINKEQYITIKGAKRFRSWNLTNAETELNTTASTVTWTSCNESLVTVTNDSLASSIATFRVNAIAVGKTTVKGLVVFTDGSEDKLLLEVTVQPDGCS